LACYVSPLPVDRKTSGIVHRNGRYRPAAANGAKHRRRTLPAKVKCYDLNGRLNKMGKKKMKSKIAKKMKNLNKKMMKLQKKTMKLQKKMKKTDGKRTKVDRSDVSVI
jgi:hypothetical protein